MAAWVLPNGPLSIAVDATTWQTYTGGIVTNCASVQIDHGVLIVGFDDTGATPYWIIKNSWGPSWGEEGYIRVQKGTDQCLITTDPTSSTVAKSGPVPPTPSQAPVTASPVAPTNGVQFLRCTSPDCTNCHTTTENQNTCIKSGAFSQKLTCAEDALIVREFNSADCSGTANITSQPLNVCAVNFGKHGLTSYNQVKCGKSAPVPPSPPAPTVAPNSPPAPTTTAAPSTKTFTQKICTSSTCASGCQSHTLPQNQCLQLTGGSGSAKAVCGADSLTITEYPTSTSCTGFSIPTTQPTNKCVKDQSGSYLENVCSGAGLEAILKGDTLATTADLAAKVAEMMKRN
eukprot:225600_1